MGPTGRAAAGRRRARSATRTGRAARPAWVPWLAATAVAADRDWPERDRAEPDGRSAVALLAPTPADAARIALRARRKARSLAAGPRCRSRSPAPPSASPGTRGWAARPGRATAPWKG